MQGLFHSQSGARRTDRKNEGDQREKKPLRLGLLSLACCLTARKLQHPGNLKAAYRHSVCFPKDV